MSNVPGTEGPAVTVSVSSDHMEAYIFTDPQKANQISKEKVLSILRENKVIFGVDEKAVGLAVTQYLGRKVVVAKGKPVENGQNGEIIYHFLDTTKGRPEMREDGSVDFYSLHLVKNVKQGELLATRVPPTEGIVGMTVYGGVMKPKPGKGFLLRQGKNTLLDGENKLIATCDGHVSVSHDGLISVSAVYEVSGDVDFSTGNIDFVGNIIVTGGIKSGFIVKADGSVEVFGGVEGGSIFAGKDVTVRGGIMGQGKGTIIAGGNVTARFVENGNVQAGENVNISDAVLNSSINAGKKIVVEGRRGAIVGGVIRAGEEVSAKVIGSHLAPLTQIEVGIKPGVRQAYKELCADITNEEKNLEKAKQMMTVLDHMARTKGELPEDKKELLEKLRATEDKINEGIEERKKRKLELESELSSLRLSKVKVQDTVFPGVTVIIGNLTLNLNDQIRRCYFSEEDGDIKIYPLV
ncbi:MAG: DUF342 domain-containing protein [Firmicutes bacterium]|nr:DUF342 domain-containing protein [Bacillota bacterium]